MINSHQPFHLKYRPNNLDELVGQDLIAITLKQALTTKRIAPAYLFSGPRGTGKTSSARIFAKSLNCLSHEEPNYKPCNKCDLCKSIIQGIALDVIEIDAASNTGVDNIRDIIERAKFAPTQARWKVYVIDECHMLSTAASNALLKTIEEPPNRVVFILATTNPERVLKTIHSRCQKFDFRRIDNKEIYKHLIYIADKEGISYEEMAIKLISKRANGGMRDAQSILDQLSLIPHGINKKNVESLLGEVSENELIDLVNSLIENKPDLLIECCANLYNSGNEPIAILEGLLNITRDLLLQTNASYSDLFYTSEEFQSELNNISKKLSKETIIHWHSNLKNIEYQIKNSSQPRLWLEIHLTSLLNIKASKNFSDINNIEETKPIIREKPDELIDKEEKVRFNKSAEFNILEEKVNPIEENNVIENKNIDITDDNQSIQLKEKWSLILSKLELPSTRMLLSQQAELINIEDNYIEIALAPNWENMIKSRKIVIEDAVKKVFGDDFSIKLTSSQNSNIKPKSKSKKVNEKDTNSNIKQNLEGENIKSTVQSENILSTQKASNNEEISIDKNSSKNLANFFNGEIIDIQD
tara:strand:+ start:25453 stop:27207 length:1755 start_codon:yes stop_codon:yes gene_type:complete